MEAEGGAAAAVADGRIDIGFLRPLRAPPFCFCFAHAKHAMRVLRSLPLLGEGKNEQRSEACSALRLAAGEIAAEFSLAFERDKE